jgi:hypothetical protein
MLQRKATIATMVVIVPILLSCGMSSLIQIRSHAVVNPSNQSFNLKSSMSKAENGDIPGRRKSMGVTSITSGTVYTTSNGYKLGTVVGGSQEDLSKPYLLPDGTPVQGLGATFSIWRASDPPGELGLPDRRVYVGPGGIIHLDDVIILVIHAERGPKEEPAFPGNQGSSWVAIKEIQKTKQ